MERALGYQYDVFLSYRRTDIWLTYVKKHFLPMFKFWLDEELDTPARIFFDEQDIEIGQSWPHRLAFGVAHSRTMVCLWSKQYFTSEWCEKELTQMLARRNSLDGRYGPPPIILAAVLADCQTLHGLLRDIHVLRLDKLTNPWIADGSATAEQLSREIKEFSRAVAHAVQAAPEHDDSWPQLATEEFLAPFRADPGQDVLPRLA